MKVSIIIPIYKVENEIERCLQSVLDQTYKNIELVLVNDCTPDDSFNNAKKISQRCSSGISALLIEHDSNQGVSVSRNTGIKSSTGDYLFFLDSDDELSSNESIELLVKEVQSRDDIILGGFNKVNELGVITPNFFKKNKFPQNQDVYLNYIKQGLLITPWAKLVRRDFLIKNNLFFKEGIYHEDFLWSFTSYRLANKVSVISEIVYNYYDRDGSITSQIKEKNIADLVSVAQEIFSVYKNDQSYFPKETLVVLETTRRTALKYLSYADDKHFIELQLQKLKEINISPFVTGKTSLLRLNLLLRSPIWFIRLYLKFKKVEIKHFGES